MAAVAHPEQHPLPTLLAARRGRNNLALATHPEEEKPVLAAGGTTIAAAGERVPGALFRVRNTFISEPEPSSLEWFQNQREVLTCPSSCVGILRNVFTDEEDGIAASPHAEWAVSTPVHEPAPPLPRPILSLFSMLDHPAHLQHQQPHHHHQQHQQLQQQAPQQQQHVQHPMQPHYPLGASPSPALEVPYAPSCLPMPYSTSPAQQPVAVQRAVVPMAYAPHGQEQQLAWSVGGAPDAVPPPPAVPALGTAEYPSVGSAAHAAGECKPCAFFHSGRCGNGVACKFCHLCDADERKRRRREKLESRRQSIRARKAGQACEEVGEASD